MKTISILSVLLFATLAAVSSALAANNPGLLNSPEPYDGKTVVVDRARLGKEIVPNNVLGCYCLDIEIHGRHIPSYLYSSQLNFIIFSEKLEQKLLAELKRHQEIHEKKFHFFSEVEGTNAPLVRLTCKIERVKNYWLAEVSKIELYGKKGEIIKTLEE
ncbi:MAG: hypothetical protein P8165_08685 [Deltaproteobacteria bacterium]|jgi:hypothetical protein